MHHRRAIKHWHEVCLRFTVSIQEVTLIFLVISSLHLLQLTPQVGAEEICGDIDIRNSVDQFRKLENCTVIEGILQILLIDNSEPADFLNLTFPKLHEITGFFLLYRVQGLTTLSNIFPNLTVIRGAKLFLNFALIIYQMQSLKEIGLPSLTIIQRGSVYIEENSQLCYVDTIDWDLIVQIGKNDNFFKSNQESNQCPNNCPSDKKCPTKNIKGRDVRLCWNKHHCQKTCPPGCNYCTPSGDKCCHESCLGGCSGEGRDSCFACTHFVYGGKCLDKCLPGTFEFANRRCITDKDCFKMDTKKLGIFERSKKVYWKLFDNKCLSECPEGHVADNKNQTMCLKCDGACPKVCQGVVIDSISSAQSLKGCTRINGHLEIQIKAGKNIVKELEESLSSIKEVDDYVKITRSFPLISLNFMKNIEKIHGNKKIKKEYSLYVLENNNLQELIETNYSKLSIVSGKVFFHNNPKLCKNKIVNFLNKISFTNWTDNDVSSETNGDRVACTVSYLKAEVFAMDSTFAFVRWSSFKNLSDHRFLIGYVVSYKEALFKNVSLYDGRDACGTDTWKVDDILANTDDNKVDEVHILTNLKPFTQYAVSIKTYTISREQDAQSAILYFQTLPDTPSSPVNVKGVSTSPSSLIISWLPPNKPNGTITYYTVIVKRQPYNEEVLYQRNYCSSPLIISDPTKKPPDPEPPLKTNKTDFWSHPKILPESCCECPKEKSSLTEEEKEKEFRIKFEDTLHNYVYVKKTKSNSGSRQKRNVDESITSTILTTTLNSTKYMNDFSKDIEIIIEPLEIYNNVTYNTSIKIRGLKHFTEYSFEIKACQDTFENRTSDCCSSKSIATARTLKKANADDIDSTSVFITVLNDTSGKVFVKWNRPIDSNGLIVTYELEYAKKNIDNLQPTRVCITQSQYLKEGGYKLDNLDAGNYSIRIHAVSLAGDGNWTIAKYFVITKSTNGIPSHVLIASIVGGIVVFLIVGSCIIYFIIKKSLHKIPNGVLYASVNPEYMSTVYVPDEWEIPRDKITLLGELGQGSFGMVYEGIFKDLEEGKHEIRCAIKTVNESATVRERIEFLNEASVMKAFSCHHVVKLIGVVSKGQPTFVVMELMANGDLKSYLRLHRPDSEDADRLPPPTLKQILQMACEIADGMGYLAAKKFVHRDLAARNCMVSEDLTVKIGDFGMTRDIYETDYYRKGGKGLLPVRWMAPESLKDGVFTSQSDVWSYGIVLWEMATLASQPYQGLSNEQVLKYVVEGGTMEKPENCPDRLYNLMAICWSHNPKTRPSFLELVSMLVADSSPCFHQVSFFSTQSNGLSYDVVEIEEALPTTPLKTNTQIASNPAIEMNSKTNSVDKNKFPFDDKDYFVETIEVTKENAVPVAEGSKGVRTNETLVNGHIHFPLTNNVKC